MSDSFKEIWLEDQISDLEDEIHDLLNQKQKLEGNTGSKVKQMN